MGILINKLIKYMKVYQTLVLLVLVAAASASAAKRRRRLDFKDLGIASGKYFIRNDAECKAALEDWDQSDCKGKEFSNEAGCGDWYEAIAGDEGCRLNLKFVNSAVTRTPAEYCKREIVNYNHACKAPESDEDKKNCKSHKTWLESKEVCGHPVRRA